MWTICVLGISELSAWLQLREFKILQLLTGRTFRTEYLERCTNWLHFPCAERLVQYLELESCFS